MVEGSGVSLPSTSYSPGEGPSSGSQAEDKQWFLFCYRDIYLDKNSYKRKTEVS